MPDVDTDYREVTYAVVDMLTHIGLIESIIGQYPQEVQAGWEERKSGIEQFANQQIEEIQQFGSAFDE